jgi:general secretion pathway protein L
MVRVAIDGDVLAIRCDGPDGEREVGSVMLADLDDDDKAPGVASLVDGMLREAGAAGAPVRLTLPASQCLRRSVDLPKAARNDLRAALGFDMDRLTPFAAESVYFDHRLLEQPAASNKIRVQLVVVPRATVDRALQTVERAGLRAEVVDVAGLQERDGEGWNFLPGAEAPRTRAGAAVPAALAVMVALLLAAAVYVPIHKDRVVLAHLKEQVTAAKQQAEASRELQDRVDRVGEQARFIFEKRLERPLFIQVVDELTRALPDDTWLFRMRYTGGEAQVFGNSDAASPLIAVIEDSPMFVNARFRAPVTRERLSDAERFLIGFDVQGAGLP